MLRIYLAARYSRRLEMVGYADQLRALGYTISSSWIDGHHETRPDIDATGTIAEQGSWADEDVYDLQQSDAIICFANPPGEPGRGGRHVEFGLAIAYGLRLALVGQREHVFHCLPEVDQYDTWEQCLAALRRA